MNRQDLDELIEVICNTKCQAPKLIIMGSHNIHYLMEKDNSKQFKVMIGAVGLIQKVMFDTHVMGNILD